jgi:hypothetical protein
MYTVSFRNHKIWPEEGEGTTTLSSIIHNKNSAKKTKRNIKTGLETRRQRKGGEHRQGWTRCFIPKVFGVDSLLKEAKESEKKKEKIRPYENENSATKE